MKKRQTVFYISRIIFTIVVFFIIFKLIDSRSVINTLQKINPGYILLIIILNLIYWVLMTLSLWILMFPFKNVDFIKFLKLNFISLSIGCFTPSHIGEGVIVLYFKKLGLNMKKGTAIFLFNKIINVFLVILFGLYGLKYFGLFNFNFVLIFIVACLIFLIIIKSRIRILIKDLIIKKYFLSFYDFFRTISDLVKKHFLYLILNIVTNFIKLLLGVLIIWLCFRAVNLNINYVIILFVFNLGRLPALLPVSIAGLGVLESGTTYLFYKLGFDSYMVLSGLLLSRAVGFLFTAVVLIITVLSTDYRNIMKKLYGRQDNSAGDVK